MKHSNFYFNLIALAFLNLFISCARHEQNTIPKDALFYSSNSLSQQAVLVSVQNSRVDLSTGLFEIELKIKNNSFHPLLLSWPLAELFTNEGTSNIPIFTQTKTDKLFFLQSKTRLLQFKPINNTELFQQLNEYGDFLQNYFLSLDFITKNNKPVFSKPLSLSLDDLQFETYLKKHSIENHLELFTLVDSDEDFNFAQRNYIEKIGIFDLVNDHSSHTDTEHNHENDFHEASEEEPEKKLYIAKYDDEIFIDQILVKLSAYKIKDTIKIHSKITNKSVVHFIFNSEKIFIIPLPKSEIEKLSLEKIKELAISPKKNAENQTSFLLKQNNRFMHNLEFETNTNNFTLFLDGFTTDTEIPLFGQSFEYRLALE